MKFSERVWSIYNVLAFMVEAIDDDTPDGLPVRCTLSDLRVSAEQLAADLANTSDRFAASERVAKALSSHEEHHE